MNRLRLSRHDYSSGAYATLMMQGSDVGKPKINHHAGDGLHQLLELVRHDEEFASALRQTETTHEAIDLALTRGITVTQEALWRHRGTLTKSGQPTWRG